MRGPRQEGGWSRFLDAVRDQVRKLQEALGEALAPEPELVPVPVSRPRDERDPRSRR